MSILILGGTAEARALARALVERGLPVTSSLAGRVSDPAMPAGEVRIGGFGGVAGLRRFLVEQQVTTVVDATHPFAAQMTRHAVLASPAAGCRLVRLQRPGWHDHPNAGGWTWVPSVADAVAAGGSARRPLLTTGRQSLAAFGDWAGRAVLVRVVDPPEVALPAPWRVVRSRGPYSYAGERQLMLDHGADLLVTKDSGGEYTSAKLDAAGDLGIPLVVISRPAPPAEVPTVLTVQAVLCWLDQTGPPDVRR